MYQVATLTLDPIMDRATALHCPDCGETLTPDKRCHNVNCEEAARVYAPRTFGDPAAFTMAGNVD